MTRPEDGRAVYEAIPVEDKRLDWIEGTTRRFNGYDHFSNQPRSLSAGSTTTSFESGLSRIVLRRGPYSMRRTWPRGRTSSLEVKREDLGGRGSTRERS
jgi:hypothetical protein